jgi:hypothetical protein
MGPLISGDNLTKIGHLTKRKCGFYQGKTDYYQASPSEYLEAVVYDLGG